MKNSKKVIVSVIIVSLTFSALPAAFASENSGSNLNDAQITTTSATGTSCEDKLSQTEKNSADKEAARLSKLKDRQAEQDTRIVNRRAELDAARIKHREDVSAKLAAKPEVKAIMEKFWAAVDAALKARRDGNETALAAFRSAVIGLESTRKLAVDAAFATLQSAACADTDKIAKKQAWTTYRDAVSNARIAFRTGVNNALTTLITARVANRDAYLTAIAAATQAKKDALAALKAATTTSTANQ